MEKNRLPSRQINNSNNNSSKKLVVTGSDIGGGDSEKPKKQRLVKKLSAVNRTSSSSTITTTNNNEENIEMGCNLSDTETDNNGSAAAAKKIKTPKKFLEDSNCVDHASVPRRLRSVMKKRGRESLSPPLQDSKKANHMDGIQVVSPSVKDGVKKSKLSKRQDSSDWSAKHVTGPITKDEAEVVETLYSLAGLVRDNDGNDQSELKTTASEVKLPALPDSKENPTPAVEDSAVAKEDERTTDAMRASEGINHSSGLDNSVKETTVVVTLNKQHPNELSNSDGGKSLHVESELNVPQASLHSMNSLVPVRERKTDNSSCNAINPNSLHELNCTSQLKQDSEKETSLGDKKPELALGASSKHTQLVHDMLMELKPKNTGLWPGLSPMALHDVGTRGSSSQSAAAKVPSWLDIKPSPIGNGFSIGKVSDRVGVSRPLKRCATHARICNLIKNLKAKDNKDKSKVQPESSRSSPEAQKLTVGCEFDRTKNSFNGLIPSSNNNGSSRDIGEVRNSFLLQNSHPQNAAASQANTLPKQSFDFLSLSTGNLVAEAATRNGNHGTAPSPHYQVPYLHSFPQHQRFMNLPMSQARYPSSGYLDQRSASTSASSQQQVQIQFPPYVGSTRGNIFVTEQQHHQQQQQLWAAHIASQYRPPGTSTTMNPLPATLNSMPNWVNGRYDPSRPDQKYIPVSQQQPQSMAMSSSCPPTMVTRQEVEAGVVRTSSPYSLQLLCNERL